MIIKEKEKKKNYQKFNNKIYSYLLENVLRCDHIEEKTIVME